MLISERKEDSHVKTANLKGVLYAGLRISEGEEEDYEKYGKGVT